MPRLQIAEVACATPEGCWEVKRSPLQRRTPLRHARKPAVWKMVNGACVHITPMLGTETFQGSTHHHFVTDPPMSEKTYHAILKRKKSLNKRTKNKDKIKRDFARKYGSREMVRWYKAQPCVFQGVREHVCGYFPPDRPDNECCHILTRGAGHGHTVAGQPNLFSACPSIHDMTENLTPEQIQARCGLDLWYTALLQWQAWEASR